ncbi:hypothetical protein CR513_16756, partial [Mucuna pruriens]
YYSRIPNPPYLPLSKLETELIQLCCVCPCLAQTELILSAETILVKSQPRVPRPVPRRVVQCMTRSSTDPSYDLDPEIELTLRRLWKARNIVVNNSSNSDPVLNFNQFYTDHSAFSSNIVAEPGEMENNDRTLKELATPDVVYQPWCIQYPQLELAQTYELKSSLIHLLPKFHGLAGEDPHKHMKEFHMVCSTMRP